MLGALLAACVSSQELAQRYGLIGIGEHIIVGLPLAVEPLDIDALLDGLIFGDRYEMTGDCPARGSERYAALMHHPIIVDHYLKL